jgi:hypothetical protein
MAATVAAAVSVQKNRRQLPPRTKTWVVFGACSEVYSKVTGEGDSLIARPNVEPRAQIHPTRPV